MIDAGSLSTYSADSYINELKKYISKLSSKDRDRLFEYFKPGFYDIIGNLPVSITSRIFILFTPKELCILRLVSKQWNSKVLHNTVWKSMCQEYSMIPERFEAGYDHLDIPIFYDIFRRSITLTKTWKSLQCRRFELQYHNGPVLSMCIPYTTRIFTGDIDGAIHVWDGQNHAYLAKLQTHTSHVSCLAYSGNLLASGSSDKTICLHQILQLKHAIRLEGHKEAVTALAFSSTEQNVLFSGSVDRTIRIWDISNGNCVRILQGQSNVIQSLIFCPSFPPEYLQSDLEFETIAKNKAGYLISSSSDRNIFLWDLKTSALHDGPETFSAVMETNGTVTAMAVYDEKAEVSDRNKTASNAYVVARMPIQIPTFLAFAAQSDPSISIFSLPGLEKTYVESPISHHATIWSISVAPIHSKLITTSGDRTAVVWDLKSSKRCVTLGGFDSAVVSSGVSPQEELLCFGTEKGTIVLFILEEFT